MALIESCATVIAHRGASAYAPEHSMAAYDLAMDMGADMLELDLRLTADGELVTAHDADLMRTIGEARLVSELTREELLGLPASVRPLMIDSIFERYGRDARYCIEIKAPTPQAERRLVRAVSRHGLRDHVLVQSFCELSLRRVGAVDAALPLLLLLREDPGAAGLEACLERVADCAVGIGPAASLVDAELIAIAHGLGLSVMPYTVNSESEMRELLSLGVDGLFTDAPDRLLRVLRGPSEPSRRRARVRGHWRMPVDRFGRLRAMSTIDRGASYPLLKANGSRLTDQRRQARGAAPQPAGRAGRLPLP